MTDLRAAAKEIVTKVLDYRYGLVLNTRKEIEEKIESVLREVIKEAEGKVRIAFLEDCDHQGMCDECMDRLKREARSEAYEKAALACNRHYETCKKIDLAWCPNVLAEEIRALKP